MLNKVILIGNLGKAPEFKTISDKARVAEFSLATSFSKKDQSGNWNSETEWHSVKCWNFLADRAQNFEKGDTVHVEGRISTRKWQDKEGKDRYTTEIIATDVSRKKKSNPDSGASKSVSSGGGDLPF